MNTMLINPGYQLSIYKRLFDSLSPSHPTPFDWDHFFKFKEIDQTVPFGDDFQSQIKPLIVFNGLEHSAGKAENIQQLKAVLDAFMSEIGTLENELELVYVSRAGKKKEQEPTSLAFPEPDVVSLDGDEAADVLAALAFSRTANLQSPMPPLLDTPSSKVADEGMIGSTIFEYDSVSLDHWLTSVSAFWMAERAPVGVQEAEAFKCRTCEYAGQCEWVAAKLEERKTKLLVSKAKGKVRPSSQI